MGIFNGLSHAIITFNTVEDTRVTGIGAKMKLCFGSDDDTLAQVLYCRPPGKKGLEWVLPSRVIATSVLPYPIFTGVVALEILHLIGVAANRFKVFYKSTQTSKEGRTWRITKNGIEEIVQEIKLSGEKANDEQTKNTSISNGQS